MAEPRVNGGSNFDSLKVSAESVRWEDSEVRINGERTMGRQRREQWTAIDEDGVILSNFYTPCTFSLLWSNRRTITHGHRRKVRWIFFFFPSLPPLQAPAYGHRRTGTEDIKDVLKNRKWQDRQYNDQWKGTKGQTIIYKVIHRKLKIEQQKPH